jgi:hypothetical protein
MAFASYRDSINKRLPLQALDRLGAVAIIPNLSKMPSDHGINLEAVKALIYLGKADFLTGPAWPNPCSAPNTAVQYSFADLHARPWPDHAGSQIVSCL